MLHHIYGNIENQEVTFVGCCRTSDIPSNSILLQVVEHHPELHWVKWSVRFRRTLKNNQAQGHPYGKYFRNPSSLTRLLEDEDFGSLVAEQNAAFLKFHEANPNVLDKVLAAALAKQVEGWDEYSVDQLLGEIRWSDTEIDRGEDRVKINGRWAPWFSRVLQMVEPKLLGFFAVRFSLANGLVWIDGSTWQEFASQHDDEIQWKDPFHDLPDEDWEYQG